MLHIVEHSLLDTFKLVPFLFLTYLAMEYLEHKAGEKTAQMVRKAGKWGPLIGGVAGVVPQCGFSAAASNLYAGRVISLGTLFAIYLSTSDEMLPIMISSDKATMAQIGQILAMKAIIGIAAGFVIDWIVRGHAHNHDGHHHTEHAHNHDDHHHTGHEHSHGTHHHNEHYQIHELCDKEHCNCEEDGVFLSAVKHTLHITLFVLLITVALNIVLHLVGEDVLATILLDKPVLGPVLAGIVGLVPNCASSIVITQLFLEKVIGIGSMMAGLLVNAGVGLVVLFRVNRYRGENLKIAGLLYIIGVVVGIALEFLL